MSLSHRKLGRGVLLGAIFMCGLAVIPGSYRYDSGTGDDDEQPTATCGEQEIGEDTTYFLVHASYPNGCYLSTYRILANSQEEANQCVVAEGYLGETATGLTGCDFFFRARQGIACEVKHVQATTSANAESCAAYRFAGQVIDDVTDAVSSGTCQRTVNMSAVNAQCP